MTSIINLINLLPSFLFLVKLRNRFRNEYNLSGVVNVATFFLMFIFEFLGIDTHSYGIMYTIHIICFYYALESTNEKISPVNECMRRKKIGNLYLKDIVQECNVCMNVVNIMIHKNSKMNSSCHSCNLYLCVECFSNLQYIKDLKQISCPICRSIIFSEIFED